MIRPITWLHLSDVHMRVTDRWSQSVVLSSMCQHVAELRKEGLAIDFILITGDLAFSGKSDEYKLVSSFLDDLIVKSEVPGKRIFCVPGNHDIDRDRQKMCFKGARGHLQSQNLVDELLEGGEDFKTLLVRQEGFRDFQESYFSSQKRRRTEDGLAYVAYLTIEDVRLAVVGLDSAWLSEGGPDDYGRILVGERQVINAFELARAGASPPHVVVTMVHHPFHLLREFDRVRVTNRTATATHFLHSGHLHEPEARAIGTGNASCLSLAAGALYETREARNSYFAITLDLLRGVRSVATHQYEPQEGSFRTAGCHQTKVEINLRNPCGIAELAEEIARYDGGLGRWSYYFAALILGRKAEFVIASQRGYTFASIGVLDANPDSNLKRRTNEFLTFLNALQILSGRMPLSEILAMHGSVLLTYMDAIRTACGSDATLEERLDRQDVDARQLASSFGTPARQSSHTHSLLEGLASEQDWVGLRQQAKRHVESTDLGTAVLAKHMLALGLANSDDACDKDQAIKLYESMVEDESIDAEGIWNVVVLLHGKQALEPTISMLRLGIEKFPKAVDRFLELGHRVAVDTGDRSLRDYLDLQRADSSL